jgi:hypothetical protein
MPLVEQKLPTIPEQKFWENIGSNERYTSTPYDGAADSRQIKQINKQINTNHKKSHDSHVSICIITFVNLKQVENESRHP